MAAAAPDEVAACCSALYGHPVAELLVGESFHPGGLAGTRALLDAAHLSAGSRLLDLGCGPGASSRLAATEYGMDVDALDASAAVVDRARAHPDATTIDWHVGDLRALPFANDTFDAVLCECVLSTVPRPLALAEMARVLRPGGSMLVSDVVKTGEPIEGLDDHALLGAALCVNDAWLPGELPDVLLDQGLELQREWDRSEDVLRLVDRIEGRLVIAASVARRLEQPLELIDGFADLDLPRARALIRSVRAAVENGELGYFAALVRPRSPRVSASAHA